MREKINLTSSLYLKDNNIEMHIGVSVVLLMCQTCCCCCCCTLHVNDGRFINLCDRKRACEHGLFDVSIFGIFCELLKLYVVLDIFNQKVREAFQEKINHPR